MKNKSPLPLRITLALCMVLFTTAWNLVRLVTSIVWRLQLDTYAPHPGALYIGATGAVALAAGGCVLWGIWRRSRWAPLALLLGGLVYAAWFWADKLLVQTRAGATWPFDLAVTVILVGFTVAVATDPRNSRYFGREE